MLIKTRVSGYHELSGSQALKEFAKAAETMFSLTQINTIDYSQTL